MDNRQIITDLLLDTRRKGMDKVVEFLDENDFFVLPASTRYQNRETGGLANHSLSVYRFAMKLRDEAIAANPAVEQTLPADSVAIAALLHDTCKVFNYAKGTANGTFHHNYRFPVGHGEKSVIALLRCGLELTDEEIMAIRWHMGSYELPERDTSQEHKEYNIAMKRTPLCDLIQRADKEATRENLRGIRS